MNEPINDHTIDPTPEIGHIIRYLRTQERGIKRSLLKHTTYRPTEWVMRRLEAIKDAVAIVKKHNPPTPRTYYRPWDRWDRTNYGEYGSYNSDED